MQKCVDVWMGVDISSGSTGNTEVVTKINEILKNKMGNNE